jgi:hypothetical protein
MGSGSGISLSDLAAPPALLGDTENGVGVLGLGKLPEGNNGVEIRTIGVAGLGAVGGFFAGRSVGIIAESEDEENPDLSLEGDNGIISAEKLILRAEEDITLEGGTGISAEEFLLRADGDITLRLDQDNNGTNPFRIRNGENIIVLSAAESGDLVIAGSLIEGSDRNSKHDIQTIDSLDVLEKVAALPVSSWRYNASPDAQHIGPMAQDFYAMFGLGSSDKGIATVDANGVSLAAIQGLYKIVQEQQTRIEELETRLTMLQDN